MSAIEAYSHGSVSITDSAGRTYKDYRATLSPRYTAVWRDIALAWLLIIALQVLAVFVGPFALPAALPVVLLFALASGFFIANLILFMHEAAHFNIHPDKAWNDRLCNIFVSSVIGIDVADYRVVHWQHHRALGTPQDSERSYFNAITLGYVLELLLMIRVLKVLVLRQEVTSQASAGRRSGARKIGMVLVALLGNAAYLGLLAWYGHYIAAAAWVLALVVFYPFFGAIRQVLEHRSFSARDAADYTREPHGVTNRMFRGGPLTFFLGGAGFRHHLLHHFDPALSYTCLPQVEAFLMNTEYADELAGSYTTYWQVFSRLFHWRARP